MKALINDIQIYIDRHNAKPQPLRWTKSADDILASIDRFCRRTLDVHSARGSELLSQDTGGSRKKGSETLLEMHQKHSPVVGETRAVT